MKGISPIISIVIVVAFTVAIGSIVAVFGTSFFQTTTGTVAQQVEEFVDCQGINLQIESVACNEDSSLLGMWHFEEGSGSVAKDYSGNGRQINLTNPQWTTEGKNGGGLQFDGTNYGHVQGSESLSPESFTIETWVYKP